MPYGTGTLGVGGIGGTVILNPPAVTITAPTGSIGTDTVTVTWTYTSPVPRNQTAYRVELRSQDGAVTLFTSGIQSGAGTSFTPAFILSAGTIYQARVEAFDGYSWSPPATRTFSSFAGGVGNFTPNPSVGSVFEIGLNGVGYMLADRPERRYQRRSAGLESPRFATGDTPFNQAIERYSISAYTDWTGGAGQKFLDRANSVSSKFWQSQGVDPFTDGELKLLPATELEIATTYANPNMMVASNILFVQTGAKQFTSRAAIGGSNTVFSIAAAGTVDSVTSDGTNWYATDGADIYRKNDAADPTTAWSTVGCDLIEWCTDRLAGTYKNGTAAVFTTFADDGTEEESGGRFSFDGAEISAITSGDGWIWFAVNRSGVSELRAWQLGGDSSSVSVSAASIPEGETITGLGAYLGNVFVRTSCTCTGGGTTANLYRGVPNEGRVTLARVVGIQGAGLNQGNGRFAGNDRYALFSWQKMTDDDISGVGAIDLSTGGWAKWFAADDEDADGPVRAIAQWLGRTVFVVDGYGVLVETTGPVAAGWLKTSHTFFGSALSKVVDDLRLSTVPMPAGATVTAEYSTNGGISYQTIDSVLSTGGQSELFEPIGVRGASVGLQFKLTADTVSPTVTLGQVRVHPLSLSDQVVSLPINCGDSITGLNGRILKDAGAGSGMRRVRVLESLMGTRVLFQDVDWPETKQATIWEMVQIDVQSDGVRAANQNRRVDSAIAVVTLRRAL